MVPQGAKFSSDEIVWNGVCWQTKRIEAKTIASLLREAQQYNRYRPQLNGMITTSTEITEQKTRPSFISHLKHAVPV